MKRWFVRIAYAIPILAICLAGLATLWDEEVISFMLLVVAAVALPSLYTIAIQRQRINEGKCYRCGYDLQGTPSGDCPECGAGRREK